MELKLEDVQSQLDARAHEAQTLQQSLFEAQAELKDQAVLLQGHHELTQQAELERSSPQIATCTMLPMPNPKHSRCSLYTIYLCYTGNIGCIESE